MHADHGCTLIRGLQFRRRAKSGPVRRPAGSFGSAGVGVRGDQAPADGDAPARGTPDSVRMDSDRRSIPLPNWDAVAILPDCERLVLRRSRRPYWATRIGARPVRPVIGSTGRGRRAAQAMDSTRLVQMGSPLDEQGRQTWELEPHAVVISGSGRHSNGVRAKIRSLSCTQRSAKRIDLIDVHRVFYTI